MDSFEEKLTEALSRKDPPPGFVARVVAQVEQQKRPSRWFSWHWLAPVTVALVLMGGFSLYREHQRRVKGEEAKEQLLFAMQIAASKLYQARQKVESIGLRRETNVGSNFGSTRN